jgi:hypothetical protein
MKSRELTIHPHKDYTIDRVVDFFTREGAGPSSLLLRSLAKRKAAIRRQIAQQQSFLAHLGSEDVLNSINQSLRSGSGWINFEYGGADRNEGLTISGHRIMNPPLTTYARDGSSSIDLAVKNSPRIVIGLFGDAANMRRGEDGYMTHLAVVSMDSGYTEAYSKACVDSTRRGYKLAEVNPSLDPNQFSQRKWNRLRRKARRRATRLVKERLNENRPISRMRRRIQKVGYTFAGAVGGAALSDYIHVPEIIKKIGDILFPLDKKAPRRRGHHLMPTPLSA